MSQTTHILEMLKRGPVTALEALQEAGCLRLAARIADLRQQGFDITTEEFKTPTGKHIARYHLKETTHGRQTH
jgi:hypothetical protein